MAGRKINIFQSDLDFCPDCGTVLPLPGLQDLVTCKKCNFQVRVEEFDGIEVHSTLSFNKPETTELDEAKGKSSDLTGPLADKRCAKCNHDGMVYSTMQTRSADEGQTVFYTCPKCRHQEIEYS